VWTAGIKLSIASFTVFKAEALFAIFHPVKVLLLKFHLPFLPLHSHSNGFLPVQVNFVGDIEKNYTLIKQELLSSGIASSVTKAMTDLVRGGYHAWGLRIKFRQL